LAFDLLITAVGIGLLVAGGDAMVRGASALAAYLGISPLMIGLTVVAFGTSAPELAVNIAAASGGNVEMSFGNIFGSNMANIGLIVAVTALMRPLEIKNVIVSREAPMMILATVFALVLALDEQLSTGNNGFDRADGLVLLLLFSVFLYYTISEVIDQRAQSAEARAEATPEMAIGRAGLLTLLGTAGLVAGGVVTVEGAEGVARGLGISEAIIGLTLVAIGTSLPELVASIMATTRGQGDLAVGNVVGSNIFNLLIVLGTTSTIRTIPVPEGGLVDLTVVLALSIMLWLMSLSQRNRIIRAEAMLLLGLYVGFLIGRMI
jgi:cation:H+ antiporter